MKKVLTLAIFSFLFLLCGCGQEVKDETLKPEVSSGSEVIIGEVADTSEITKIGLYFEDGDDGDWSDYTYCLNGKFEIDKENNVFVSKFSGEIELKPFSATGYAANLIVNGEMIEPIKIMVKTGDIINIRTFGNTLLDSPRWQFIENSCPEIPDWWQVSYWRKTKKTNEIEVGKTMTGSDSTGDIDARWWKVIKNNDSEVKPGIYGSYLYDGSFYLFDYYQESIAEIESPSGDVYTIKTFGDDGCLGCVYTLATRIEKNGEYFQIDEISEYDAFILDFYGFNKANQPIFGIYKDHKKDDRLFLLTVGSKIIFKSNYFGNVEARSQLNSVYLMYGKCDANFRGSFLNDGNFALYNVYCKYEYFDPEEPIISDTKIETVVFQQKSLIKTFYSLIDQGKFKEAYEMVDQPFLSFEEFIKQRNEVKFSIDAIFLNSLFIKSYPQDNPDLYSNENLYNIHIFQRTGDSDWWLNRNIFLQVKDLEKIQFIEKVNKNFYRNTWSYEDLLIQVYFSLLKNKKFEEAFKLQATQKPSLEMLKKNYENAVDIQIKYLAGCGLVFSGGKADVDYWEGVDCYSEFCKTNNPNSNRLNSLIEITDENGKKTAYYATRDVKNGKISTIFSRSVDVSNMPNQYMLHCGGGLGKPVIYLYPTSEKEIKVGLNVPGGITVSYPEIDSSLRSEGRERGERTVIAKPDGTLINKADGLEYSYLFREGLGDLPNTITEGFVVKNEDTVSFLQEKLAYLGLTPREYNEFIVYWRPIMKNNKYNLIKFLGEEYTSQAQLIINPKPDSIQRVFMIFKGLDEPVKVKEQVLKPFVRSGFAVIEWGGSEI